jgi:hypothetical protein
VLIKSPSKTIKPQDGKATGHQNTKVEAKYPVFTLQRNSFFSEQYVYDKANITP